MIGPKRTGVLPLRINGSVILSNSDPTALANGNPRPLISFLEPRHDVRCLRAMPGRGFIVIRKGTIKWILARCEFYRNIIAPVSWIWIIESAIAPCPILVPRTLAIRHGIIPAWLLSNPKYRRHDPRFPRETLSCLRGGQKQMARGKHQRIHIDHQIL